MIKELLNIIQRDGLISRPRLASELGITEEVVADGIDQLVRMGYLTEEETGQLRDDVQELPCQYVRKRNR